MLSDPSVEVSAGTVDAEAGHSEMCHGIMPLGEDAIDNSFRMMHLFLSIWSAIPSAPAVWTSAVGWPDSGDVQRPPFPGKGVRYKIREMS
jgi:hypothetical protein